MSFKVSANAKTITRYIGLWRDVSIEEELRKLRERAGLTQEQLSFMAGLSRPYVSQLERDLKSPTVETLFRICDALEVSAASVIKRMDAARKGMPV
jgi:transcriptional regulator with XRE-family HTH domain